MELALFVLVAMVVIAAINAQVVKLAIHNVIQIINYYDYILMISIKLSMKQNIQN